jgi:hypothetical protein
MGRWNGYMEEVGGMGVMGGGGGIFVGWVWFGECVRQGRVSMSDNFR